MIRPNVPIIVPQLDVPSSVCAQRRQPLPIAKRTTISGGGCHDDSNSDYHDNRFREERGYPGRRRY